MKPLILSFDVEQYPSKELELAIHKEEALRLGNAGLMVLLNLLKTHDITSTFFVTEEFSGRFPESVKKIINNGHELAMHGSCHNHDYEDMVPQEALEILKEDRGNMERKFSSPINGFRGPRMSRPSYQVLSEAGFVYDSSLHPTYVPTRYNNLSSPRGIHKKDSITIFPISVTPFLRLPFSWLWFRRLGLTYSRMCTSITFRKSEFVHLYFHPWEFIDPPLTPRGLKSKIILGGCGKPNLDRLDKFIRWTKIRGMQTQSMINYLQNRLD